MPYTGEDEKILKTCPFNPAHQILPKRWLTHLVRCEKVNPIQASKMKKCLWNVAHRIEANKLEDHLQNCPDRIDKNAVSLREKYSLGQEGKKEFLNESKVRRDRTCTTLNESFASSIAADKHAEPEEFWDDEIVIPFKFKPSLETTLLREPKGMSKSKRVEFRQGEKNRVLQTLQAKAEGDKSVIPGLTLDVVKREQVQYRKLRLPKSLLKEEERKPSTPPSPDWRDRPKYSAVEAMNETLNSLVLDDEDNKNDNSFSSDATIFAHTDLRPWNQQF